MTKDIDPLVEARGRLTVARAFGHMILKAYDALLYHGVNFKSLPEWKQHEEKLEDIEKMPFQRGVQEHVSWMGRLGNAIDAAVRRKGFRVVTKEEQDDD